MAQTAIRFEAAVDSIGERPLVKLPDEASTALPSRGQVAVIGSAGGRRFRTVVEPDGLRGHWLAVDGELEAALDGLDPESVEFELEPTKEWPEPELPDDLRAALDAAPDLAETWLDITPMARWEWVRWVNATKNPDTRARRVEVSISKLRGGKRRPCCFDLSSCTDPEVSKSGKLLEIPQRAEAGS